MGFYALSYAWLALLIPPLVALYFLKLKRPRLEIPSLVLWKQVLDDKRVNSPFQRFKRHILLLLQLLLLALLILAAMQPYREGGAAKARRTPILIDRSASMAALDKPGGQTRLDAAKSKVRDIINNLAPAQELALVAFSDSATRLTDFTSNKRLLHDALDRLEVEHVPSALADALRITQAMSQRTPFDEAVLFSDGNFPTETDVAQSFRVNYQRLDPAGPNMGVTQLVARRGSASTASAAGRWDVFVHIAASRPVPGSEATSMTGIVEVLLDGQPLADQVVTIAAGQSERILFPVFLERAGVVSVRLRPQGFDALRIDDEAAIRLDPARRLDVFVPDSLTAYRAALRSVSDVELHGGATTDGGVFDLVITDAADPSQVAPVTFHVGVIPADLSPLLAVSDEGGAVIDWRRDAPLLAHVQWGDVLLLGGPVARPEVRENDYENLGFEVLVYGQRGPLLVQRREAARVSFYLLFDSDRSTLPYRVGFPILLQNLVRIAMHDAGLLETPGARTGVLPRVAHFRPNETLRVSLPGGGTREAQADAAGVVVGVPAPRAGVYRITGGEHDRQVVASLLDARETSLAGVDEIRFNELAVAATEAPVKVDRPLWRWLALAGLALLLVEWWFFQRRPGGFRGAAPRAV